MQSIAERMQTWYNLVLDGDIKGATAFVRELLEEQEQMVAEIEALEQTIKKMEDS